MAGLASWEGFDDGSDGDMGASKWAGGDIVLGEGEVESGLSFCLYGVVEKDGCSVGAGDLFLNEDLKATSGQAWNLVHESLGRFGEEP